MRTQINNILWYSKSHIIDRDENTIISVWHPAEHCRAPDWLSLTCYRCDVNSDRGGGGGDFGGKCVEEVRGVHSGLCQGTGGVLEPGPRGRKAKPGLMTADTNPVFRIWRGRWWSAGGRWNLYLCATHSPVCHTGTHASRTPGASITFILLCQHTWMFWSPWLREAAWRWVF